MPTACSRRSSAGASCRPGRLPSLSIQPSHPAPSCPRPASHHERTHPDIDVIEGAASQQSLIAEALELPMHFEDSLADVIVCVTP